MAHEGNATALRSRTEKGYLHSAFFQVIGKLLDCRPGPPPNGVLVVRETR